MNLLLGWLQEFQTWSFTEKTSAAPFHCFVWVKEMSIWHQSPYGHSLSLSLSELLNFLFGNVYNWWNGHYPLMSSDQLDFIRAGRSWMNRDFSIPVTVRKFMKKRGSLSVEYLWKRAEYLSRSCLTSVFSNSTVHISFLV